MTRRATSLRLLGVLAILSALLVFSPRTLAQDAVSDNPPVADSAATPAAPDATADEAVSGETESPAEGDSPSDEAASIEVPAEATPPADGGASDFGTAEDVAAAEDASPAAETATVKVYAYDCPADPGPVTPGVDPAGCVVSVAVDVSAAADGTDLGVFPTDGTGVASIVAPLGSTVVVTENVATLPIGYIPLGTGEATVGPLEADAAIAFVHVVEFQGPVGRLQLARGECPTSGDARFEFRVLPPRAVTAQAQDTSCHSVPGAQFLIQGGSLPAEGITKVTGDDGSWRGPIPPAESYTITDLATGNATTVAVEVDELSAVIGIEYIHIPAGTLSVRRFICDSDVDQTSIEVSDVEPDPGEGCVPEDGSFQLDEGNPFSGGGDGAVSISVAVGTYKFADVASDETEPVDVTITEGTTTWVLVKREATPGDISVTYNLCEDPSSSSGDPSDPGYWATNCNNPVQGAELLLVSTGTQAAAAESGLTAITDANGVATWIDVASGTYKVLVTGSPTTCAMFVGSAPSLSGFDVNVGALIEGRVFGCAKSTGNPGGGDPGGGNPGGGDPGGGNPGGGNPGGENPGNGSPGDGTGGNTDTANGGQYVSQLPNTGTGRDPGGMPAATWLWLLLATVALSGAVVKRRLLR